MTNLKEAQSYRLFDMLDLDKSGQMEFDEFYVLMCILIAIKVRVRPLAARSRRLDHKETGVSRAGPS